MNKQKLTVICGIGVLALVAGFGARPASALPTALPLTRLSAPVLDHDGDFWRTQWQSRYEQGRDTDRNNYSRDWQRNRDDRNRDRDQQNHDRNQQNRDRDDRNRDRDDRNRDRDQQNRDDRNRVRDDRR